MRQVVLDTETTGLEPEQGGHRVIEVGAVEIVDRKITGRRLQLYMDPERGIDDAAFDVHGLDAEFLAGKPKFAEVADEFLAFVEDAEVIIHNAPFDLAFIDSPGAAAEGWLAAHGAVAVIVRPDRYVFATARDETEIERALDKLDFLLR